MRLFLILVGAIFGISALLVVIGAFLPADRLIERGQTIPAAPNMIIDHIADLTTHPDWSHSLAGLTRDQIVFGQTFGASASAAWQTPERVGALEIMSVEDGQFVQINHSEGTGLALLTYAVQAEDGGQTLVLVSEATEAGGFPYLGRWRALVTKGGRANEIDRSIAALAESLKTTS